MKAYVVNKNENGDFVSGIEEVSIPVIGENLVKYFYYTFYALDHESLS